MHKLIWIPFPTRAFPADYDRDLYKFHLQSMFKGLLIHLDDPTTNIQVSNAMYYYYMYLFLISIHSLFLLIYPLLLSVFICYSHVLSITSIYFFVIPLLLFNNVILHSMVFHNLQYWPIVITGKCACCTQWGSSHCAIHFKRTSGSCQTQAQSGKVDIFYFSIKGVSFMGLHY